MRVTLPLAVCLALLLPASAAEPYVDDVFSQNDVQDIRQFITSVTADHIVSISSEVGEEHDAGVISRKAIQISRDGTQSPITFYLRSDVASVRTSDKNNLLREYRVRKGPQGWVMDMERFSWHEYPFLCLWYILLGSVVHLLFFGLGCICLIFVQRYARSGYGSLLSRWAQFNIVLLLVASAIAGLWGCLIFGRFYKSTDYVSDFSPFIPITQGVIDARFGNQVGYLCGITLRQLQLIWMAFAGTTWILTLWIYFRIRRRAIGPGQTPEPIAVRREGSVLIL